MARHAKRGGNGNHFDDESEYDANGPITGLRAWTSNFVTGYDFSDTSMPFLLESG